MLRKVYPDTSILSFLFDQREDYLFLSDRTRDWWENSSGFYHLYISDETIIELNRGSFPYKKEMLGVADQIESLEITKEIIEIAHVYIDHKLMSKQIGGDAFHLACASFYQMDFLLTWNYKHLANGNKKQHIRIINTRMGLFTPDILTPIELYLFGEEQSEDG